MIIARHWTNLKLLHRLLNVPEETAQTDKEEKDFIEM